MFKYMSEQQNHPSGFIPKSEILPGWERSSLASESLTAIKRQGAVLNMVQNGAQSLTILAMNPDIVTRSEPRSFRAGVNAVLAQNW